MTASTAGIGLWLVLGVGLGTALAAFPLAGESKFLLYLLLGVAVVFTLASIIGFAAERRGSPGQT